MSKAAYGLIIFTSAFLLFQVQPMLGRMILPRFGGSAEVWIVCLLFFQTVLLLGYAYAHWLIRKCRARMQGRVHAALLIASLILLPVGAKGLGTAPAASHPAGQILGLLAIGAGLPYLLLSATSPLLQAWWAQSEGSAPYRFYALSNVGSMLALLSYPVLIEPWLGLSHQALVWSWAYAAVAVGCAALGVFPARLDLAGREEEDAPAPTWQMQALWIALAACGSALLLGFTHQITQNIAAVPLLWVIPLALYLLTFILCFEGRNWYRRGIFLRLLGIALGSMAYGLSPGFNGLPLSVILPLFCGSLCVCCMFCHGELARLKPHPRYLTTFYLMIALGGALGAFFVAIVAPALFAGNYELRVALAGCVVLVLVVNHRDPASPFYRAQWQPAWLVMVGLAVTLIASLALTARQEMKGVRLMARNFYGVLRVVEQTAPSVVVDMPGGPPIPEDDLRFEKLMNGAIDHGLEFTAPARRDYPTSYYGPLSGVGVTLKAAGAEGPLTVGVIGLGVGTLAAYGRAGDRYRFYEINPLVIRLANQEFGFLRDSKAKVDVIPGDGRLSLEREPPGTFDVLVVDAFSSDSIPVHLLTREAFALYFSRLKPRGVLAVHISNQYLNLAPVVRSAAVAWGKEGVAIKNDADSARGVYRSTWLLVGDAQGFSGQTAIEAAGRLLGDTGRQVCWTDDYSALFKVLRR